ncbi:MAG: iron ABC transporter permease [Pseudomonadota bacterium]
MSVAGLATGSGAMSADRRATYVSVILMAALTVLAFASLTLGLEAISPGTLWSVLSGNETGDAAHIAELRWQRFATAAGIGAALALSGAILQTALRNPLAEPGVIGLSSGAALAATLVMLATTGYVATWQISLAAIVGSMAAVAAVTLLARSPNGVQPLRLILAGIAFSALAGAVITAATLVGPPHRLPRLLVWLSGDLNGSNWADLRLIWSVLLIAAPLIIVTMRRLDVAMLDPISGAGLGNRRGITLMLSLFMAASLAGVATTIGGIVIFVGLIAPHLAHRLVGPVNRRRMPVAALTGALIVAGADLFGRLLDPPTQLPAGLICGVIGAPFFFLLMRHRNG